jgi:nucleoside-diphosphate-sugar epimerase
MIRCVLNLSKISAQGMIGHNLADRLLQLGDWEVIGVSRRQSRNQRIQHLTVDLLGEADSRTLRSRTQVTHIFYAAYQERPTWAEVASLT